MLSEPSASRSAGSSRPAAGRRAVAGVRTDEGAILGRALATGRNPAWAAVVCRSHGVGTARADVAGARGVAVVADADVEARGVAAGTTLLAAFEEAADDLPDKGVVTAVRVAEGGARVGRFVGDGAALPAGRTTLAGDEARDLLPPAPVVEEDAEDDATEEREASEGREVVPGVRAVIAAGFSGLLVRVRGAVVEGGARPRRAVAGAGVVAALVPVSALRRAGVRGCGCCCCTDEGRGRAWGGGVGCVAIKASS